MDEQWDWYDNDQYDYDPADDIYAGTAASDDDDVPEQPEDAHLEAEYESIYEIE